MRVCMMRVNECFRRAEKKKQTIQVGNLCRTQQPQLAKHSFEKGGRINFTQHLRWLLLILMIPEKKKMKRFYVQFGSTASRDHLTGANLTSYYTCRIQHYADTRGAPRKQQRLGPSLGKILRNSSGTTHPFIPGCVVQPYPPHKNKNDTHHALLTVDTPNDPRLTISLPRPSIACLRTQTHHLRLKKRRGGNGTIPGINSSRSLDLDHMNFDCGSDKAITTQQPSGCKRETPSVARQETKKKGC